MSTLHEAVDRHAPERTALVDVQSGERITYGALASRSRALASWLAKNGVAAGDRVVVVAESAPWVFELARRRIWNDRVRTELLSSGLVARAP